MATTFLITNGDVGSSSVTGRPVMVAGRGKLDQDLKEILSTSYRDTGIGAGIHELVGSSDGGEIAITSLVEQRIYRAVNMLREIARKRPGLYSPDERIARIDRVFVAPVAGRPGTFRFKVDVTTETGASRGVSGQVG